MTIFLGQYAAGGMAAEEPINPAIGLRVAPTVGIFDAETLGVAGSKLSTQPVNERAARTVGAASETFALLDFYNRIHMEFTSIDLGNLISTQTRDFNLWNAYFVPQTLNSITPANDDGLLLTEPSPAPVEYTPLQELTYQLSITTDGPSTIDATYLFEFESETLELAVIGSRLLLFPFEPEGEMLESLEWATDVMESYDGTEQRVGLRTAPRQRIEFEVLTEEGIADTKLRALLFDWLARPFGLPIWFEMRLLTAAVSSGSLTISAPTADADFRVGSLAMIYENQDVLEVLEIASTTSTTITFESQLANSYTAKAYVMPVRTAHAVTQVSRTNTANNVSTTQIAFITLDNVDLSDTTGAALHSSKVLLDDANFMDRNINENFTRRVKVIDSVTGQYQQLSGVDRSRTSLRKRWQAKTRADLWRIRKLLHSFAGKRTSFFLPSFRRDLVLIQDIGPSSTTIRISNCSFTQLYKSRRPYGDLRIVLTSGTTYVRQITGSAVDGSDEVLTLASSLSGSSISVASVSRIEFVSMVRIADDKARIVHIRAGTAQIDVNLTTCKE